MHSTIVQISMTMNRVLKTWGFYKTMYRFIKDRVLKNNVSVYLGHWQSSVVTTYRILFKKNYNKTDLFDGEKKEECSFVA